MTQHTSALLALLAALPLALHCRGPEPAPRGVDVADEEGCRSFAAVGSVRVNDTPGWQRCVFDAARAEHRCDITVDGERLSSVTEYASLADFIEAGQHVGKITSLTELVDEGGQRRRVSYRYDELGRVSRRIDEHGGRTSVTRYADYDDAGRPRRATLALEGQTECADWVADIEYSDPERLVRERAHPQDPERCGFVERTRIERYDAAGNRVSLETADGGGMARLFATHRADSTARVCL
jgi:YD repeat-containing protein